MEVSTRPGAEAGHVDIGTGSPGMARSHRKAVGIWPISFTVPIPSPIVITSIMSVNEDGWYTARATNADDNEFELMLQREEMLAEQDQAVETIGYFAVTQTATALGTIGGVEYWAVETDRFDELGRCERCGRTQPCP